MAVVYECTQTIYLWFNFLTYVFNSLAYLNSRKKQATCSIITKISKQAKVIINWLNIFCILGLFSVIIDNMFPTRPVIPTKTIRMPILFLEICYFHDWNLKIRKSLTILTIIYNNKYQRVLHNFHLVCILLQI